MKTTVSEKKTGTAQQKGKSKKIRRDKPAGKTGAAARGGRPPAEDLIGRTGQLGAIVTKGLDLAEAGLKLGINIINKVGAAAPGQIIDRIAGSVNSAQTQYQQRPEETVMQATHQSVDEAAEQQNLQRNMYIVNRLPLFPGSPVYLSFSINNDSTTAARKISMELEDFIGVTNGFKISSKAFSIKPADTVIAPADFEKFTLTGNIPNKAPVDSYNSWIKVPGEEEVRIPVMLAVSARQ